MGVHTGEVRLITRAVEVPRGSLDELQQAIGIAFRDITLLQEALTHSSFANESPHVSPRDNERLEYLGDAVLQLITAEYLYKLRPGAAEGELTQVRSAMVNTNTLASLSEGLGIGHYLYLGKGISKGGGRSLRSLLANAFEAVLGSIFLDQGYEAAYHFYLDRFRAHPEPIGDENFKGRLQQVVQERFGQTPYYDSAASRGTGHGREYTAVVFAGAEPLGTGHAHTKQGAEQEAAKEALEALQATAPRREHRRHEPEATEPAQEAKPRSRRGGRRRAPETPPAAAAEPELVGEEPAVGPTPEPAPEERPAAIEPEPEPAPTAEPKPMPPHVPPPAVEPPRPLEPPRFEFGALPPEPERRPEATATPEPEQKPKRARAPRKPRVTAAKKAEPAVEVAQAKPARAPRRRRTKPAGEEGPTAPE